MKIKTNYILSVAVVALLTGCSSNNIRGYRADASMKADIPYNAIQKMHVKSVTMNGEDSNSIMCRAAGNIYLPQKMTYSQYVSDAMRKSFIAIDKFSESSEGVHSISVVLSKVSFDSVAGEWYINGDITVDQNKPVAVNTVTEYGTAYIADTACRNTAEAFDEAVANFIKKILNHPEILKNLH